MRDLYQRLNIQRQSSDSEDIRTAITTCPDDQIARIAEHVLLDPKRRRYYDLHHRLLTTIGQIRDNLDIPESNAWNSLQLEDFDLVVDSQSDNAPLSDLEQLLGDVGMMDEEDSDFSGSTVVDGGPMGPGAVNWVRFALAGVVVALLGIVVVTLVSLFSGSAAGLPEHGEFVRHIAWPAECSVAIVNSGPKPGHVWVKFVHQGSGRLVLSVLVREGGDFTVELPPGRYDVRYQVGERRDWNSDGFDEVLREVDPDVVEAKKGAPLVTIPFNE